jgi:RimJ/RimL family protein N-acetyltransferase
MLDNQNLILKSKHIRLVPYLPIHVDTYHLWMSSKELQELTCSEPLTIKQEYEMCESWKNDPDKLTFIIHSPSCHTNQILEKSLDAGGMIGDVNLYISTTEAEVEIMIAEPDFRRKGLGLEALKMLFTYGTTVLKLKKFVAKIGYSNIQSIKLFDKFGFLLVSNSEYFQQHTLERVVDDEFLRLIHVDFSTIIVDFK